MLVVWLIGWGFCVVVSDGSRLVGFDKKLCLCWIRVFLLGLVYLVGCSRCVWLVLFLCWSCCWFGVCNSVWLVWFLVVLVCGLDSLFVVFVVGCEGWYLFWWCWKNFFVFVCVMFVWCILLVSRVFCCWSSWCFIGFRVVVCFCGVGVCLGSVWVVWKMGDDGKNGFFGWLGGLVGLFILLCYVDCWLFGGSSCGSCWCLVYVCVCLGWFVGMFGVVCWVLCWCGFLIGFVSCGILLLIYWLVVVVIRCCLFVCCVFCLRCWCGVC